MTKITFHKEPLNGNSHSAIYVDHWHQGWARVLDDGDVPTYCGICGAPLDQVDTTMFGGGKSWLRWCAHGHVTYSGEAVGDIVRWTLTKEVW